MRVRWKLLSQNLCEIIKEYKEKRELKWERKFAEGIGCGKER